MNFILFIFVIFIIILILGVSFITRFVRIFIKRPERQYQGHNSNGYHRDQNENNSDSIHNRKVFSKDEGEYVDYEEV